VKVDPQNVSALFDLANICSSMGKIEQSLKHYREVVKLDPKNEMARFRVKTLISFFSISQSP